MVDETDVQPDSSQAEDVVEDSSLQETEEVVEEEQELEEPTSQEGVSEARVPYERVEKLAHQNQELRDKLNYLEGQISRPVVKEEVDPYANIQDPQTKLFYQDLDKRIAKGAERKIQEAKAPLLRQNEILTRQLAQMQHKLFKEENTDVVEGSPEETEIAQYVAQGMPLDKATWAVMGPKRAAGAQKQVVKKQIQKKEMKAKANLATTSGVPQSSGLPPTAKGFTDSFREKMEASWDGTIA